MIKALQFLSDKNQSFSKNYLLVGDNDFLYLYVKNQIVKKLQKKDETLAVSYTHLPLPTNREV